MNAGLESGTTGTKRRGPVTVLILASGRGERFIASGGDGHKLDALLEGKSLLQHVTDAVIASRLPYHLVRIEGGTEGMGESIALGVRATADAAGWLILPADLPLVQPATLSRVAAALAHHTVVLPRHRGRQGHPVGFGAELYADLAGITGSAGALSVVVRAQLREGAVFDLHVNDVGILQDVDCVDDLERARKRLQRRRNAAKPPREFFSHRRIAVQHSD